MTRASRLGLAGAVALAACGDTTTLPITLLNLDRPVDVSFACYGGMRLTKGAMADANQPIVQTAMPTAACEALSPVLIPRTKDPDPTKDGVPIDPSPLPGQEIIGGKQPVPSWYAFILQSSSGTVAVATWAVQPAEKMTGGISNQGGDFQVL